MANKLKQYQAAKDLVTNPWSIKVAAANKYYKEWESKFKCKRLEEYYEAFQWRELSSNIYYKPYVLNMVYSTIKIKMANMLIQNPEFIVGPTPGTAQYNLEFAAKSALMKQDTINTLVSNPNVNFVPNTKLALLDYFFRFGILESLYAADFNNPNAKRIVTDVTEGLNSITDSEKVIKNKILPEVPENERIYWKHIPASRFRVSTSDSPFLHNCSWCGYYEYFYTSTLRNTKGIHLPANSSIYTVTNEFADSLAFSNLGGKDQDNPDMLAALQRGSVAKVWKIWNNELNKLCFYLDGSFAQIYEDDFERLPFTDLKTDERVNGSYYPIPPVWQWLSQQDEINQAREQMRNYRKRFTRKFEVLKNAVEQEELEKFKSELDGEIITVKKEGAIKAISNPEIGLSIEDGLRAAMGDFNIISGTSAEAQNANTDRQTATAAKLTNMRAQARESVEQIEFNKFLCRAAREGLFLAVERMSEGLWVRYQNNPGDELIATIGQATPTYQWISSQDLDDGYDFTIEMNVLNSTPAQQQEELGKFTTFMSMMTQFPQLAFDPDLTREAAYRCGYRNEKIIGKMQKAAIMQMMAQVSGMSKSSGGAGGNSAAGRIASQQPNSVEDTQAQLQNQVNA